MTSRRESIKKDIDTYLGLRGKELYPTDSILHQACRYALAGEGKRFRAMIIYEILAETEICKDAVFDLCSAIEFIHCYSLVHDDLPCMDDDDLRRGRPTVHVKFGEANALLVGDALLSDSFLLLARAFDRVEAQAELAHAVRVTSEAIGGRGMVYGQTLDIEGDCAVLTSQNQIDEIHIHKTGKLIGLSAYLAALLSGLGHKSASQYFLWGEKLGLSYQIKDDLIDVESSIGKSSGKDQKLGRATYLTILGLEKSLAVYETITQECCTILGQLVGSNHPLHEIQSSIFQRKH